MVTGDDGGVNVSDNRCQIRFSFCQSLENRPNEIKSEEVPTY